MGGSNALVAGAVSGLVGLVLMVVETIRVLNGSSLNGLHNALLFVGLGLLALGGVLLVYAVLAETSAVDSDDQVDNATAVTETVDDPA
jgi:hypothetical protein